MRRFPYLFCVFILSISLTSCFLSPSLPEKILLPGDSVDGFTVEQGSPDLPYFYFRYFCDYLIDVEEPITNSINCDVPAVTGLVIDIGWLAKESEFSSNWENIEWELYIDGYQIALDEFDWFESVYPVKLEDNKSRSWLIDLKNLDPGQHNLRLVQNIKTTIDDGYNIYQPGRYDFEANFTVSDKMTYPAFSSNTEAGLNNFSSKNANLDFLYYLPEDYYSQPQESWPLLIYLHGTPFRGASLELLLQEPLPRTLESENNFPFIVVLPIGDGRYEFWIEDNITASLFALLDDIQNDYAIDTNRIYLIGDGMGGNGVWNLGLKYPDKFAAIVPIGGYIGYPFEVPDNICDLKDVPVWAFHGGKDVNVPASVQQELVDALNACGGIAKITTSDDMTINILYNVYKNPDLYDWLLAQSK